MIVTSTSENQSQHNNVVWAFRRVGLCLLKLGGGKSSPFVFQLAGNILGNLTILHFPKCCCSAVSKTFAKIVTCIGISVISNRRFNCKRQKFANPQNKIAVFMLHSFRHKKCRYFDICTNFQSSRNEIERKLHPDGSPSAVG